MPLDLENLFREYLRECRYLRNLSPNTIGSYEHCSRMLVPFVTKREGDWKQEP